jgi:hypothetical protein
METISRVVAIFLLCTIVKMVVMAFIWHLIAFFVGCLAMLGVIASMCSFFGSSKVFSNPLFASAVEGFLKAFKGDASSNLISKAADVISEIKSGDLEQLKRLYEKIVKGDSSPPAPVPSPIPTKSKNDSTSEKAKTPASDAPQDKMYTLVINGRVAKLCGSSWLHLKHTSTNTHEMKTVYDIVKQKDHSRTPEKGWTVVAVYDHDVCDYSDGHTEKVSLEKREDHTSCCSKCTVIPRFCTAAKSDSQVKAVETPVATATPTGETKSAAATETTVASFDDIYRHAQATTQTPPTTQIAQTESEETEHTWFVIKQRVAGSCGRTETWKLMTKSQYDNLTVADRSTITSFYSYDHKECVYHPEHSKVLLSDRAMHSKCCSICTPKYSGKCTLR